MTHLTQSEAIALLDMGFNVAPESVGLREVTAFVAEMTPSVAEQEVTRFLDFVVQRDIDRGTIQIKNDRMDDSDCPCVQITVRIE